jgi:hypothetical protein
LGLWIAMSAMARMLMFAATKRYREGAAKHFPKAPAAGVDPDASGSSFAFMMKMFAVVFFLALVRGVASSRHVPWLYEAVMGGFILVEFQWIAGHARTWTIYRYAASGGVKGWIFYRRWLRYRTFIVDLLCFAALCALLFVFLERPFFAGGALASVGLALYCARYAKPPPDASAAPVPETQD